MRVWFDTEFIDDGRTIDLISIGLVAEDGREYYAENEDADHSRACPWVRANVLPHLTGPLRSRRQIAADLTEFCGRDPEFWAWFASYDWVVLAQIYGRMMDLPEQWPMYCLDVRQLMHSLGDPRIIDPKKTHHALDDARWTRDVWRQLQGTTDARAYPSRRA